MTAAAAESGEAGGAEPPGRVDEPCAALQDAPGLRPLRFVLMPFGTKDDPAAGKVHFDAIYEGVIRPAVEEAGMQCVGRTRSG